MKQEFSIENYSREKINSSVNKFNNLNVKVIDFKYPLSLLFKINTQIKFKHVLLILVFMNVKCLSTIISLPTLYYFQRLEIVRIQSAIKSSVKTVTVGWFPDHLDPKSQVGKRFSGRTINIPLTPSAMISTCQNIHASFLCTSTYVQTVFILQLLLDERGFILLSCRFNSLLENE